MQRQTVTHTGAMAARPPPARPHIGLNPSHRFSSYSVSEWAEDDAWDSGSDSEAASASVWKRTGTRASSSTTAPKPVPRPALNHSSSTLAFSYTHVNAPSPSSYPPRPEQPSKNGWTIVRTSTEHQRTREAEKATDSVGYVDVEGAMVIGDFDPEAVEEAPAHHGRPRLDRGTVRGDAEAIVNGTHSTSLSLTPVLIHQSDPLLVVERRQVRRPDTPGSEGNTPDPETGSEKLNRERSIRSNKRQKFVDCITAEDVNIGMVYYSNLTDDMIHGVAAQLRKLAWNGVPGDLRPIAWPLLLVSIHGLRCTL